MRRAFDCVSVSDLTDLTGAKIISLGPNLNVRGSVSEAHTGKLFKPRRVT